MSSSYSKNIKDRKFSVDMKNIGLKFRLWHQLLYFKRFSPATIFICLNLDDVVYVAGVLGGSARLPCDTTPPTKVDLRNSVFATI